MLLDFASKKMNGESSSYDELQSLLQGGSSRPHNVPLKYLRNITNNFSDERLLGEGGFGTVYEGVLENGETIAVKKLNSSIPGVKDRQFENEAGHLMRLKHPNIVLLVGWCSDTENIYVEYNGKYICAEKSERLLCLEYMPKGNLRGYLSDESSGLGWDTRYKIIEGICYGLCYLHEEWQFNAPIVHMDLKPANILLDNNMMPKIADFGLSRLFSEEKTWTHTISRDGTLGYMSPEYINKGVVSTKSDIFSLGVIIIEIVTGRRDYPDETGTPCEEFVETVLHNWTHRKGVKSLFGVSLEVDYQQIRRCIQIGLDCVKTDRSKRPTISQIIKALHRPESAHSSNIKGVHGPQSGKRDRNCGEISWMERLAKKHTPGFSIYETFTVALHQWQKKTALRRIRVIFTAVAFVVLLKKRGSSSSFAPFHPQAAAGHARGDEGADSSAAFNKSKCPRLVSPRLVWTPELHKRFVDAVAHLGIKNAVPKKIMQLMAVDGLTRGNVASHLQSYRRYLKQMQGLSNKGPSPSHQFFASTPVPHSLVHEPQGQ